MNLMPLSFNSNPMISNPMLFNSNPMVSNTMLFNSNPMIDNSNPMIASQQPLRADRFGSALEALARFGLASDRATQN